MESSKPDGTATPGNSATPDSTSKPGATSKPGSTSKPDESIKPGETPSPENSSAPMETLKPGETSKPDESIKPEQTNNPNPGSSTKKVKVGTKAKVAGNTYKVTAKGKVTLIAAKKNVKSATVPRTVKIKRVLFKVTAIAPNVFKNNKKLTTVIIGKYVTKVGNNAFKGCKKLKTVKFAKGISAKTKKSLKKQIVKAGAKKAKFK